ncbi:hypothetical protein Q9R32_14775, partial [Actinotalea sp. AC32]|nr:hypothetical protein [Actinotalea sp. AC32]
MSHRLPRDQRHAVDPLVDTAAAAPRPHADDLPPATAPSAPADAPTGPEAGTSPETRVGTPAGTSPETRP